MHLEDRLQELYFQSKLVVEYIKSRNYVNLSEVAAALGYVALTVANYSNIIHKSLEHVYNIYIREDDHAESFSVL